MNISTALQAKAERLVEQGRVTHRIGLMYLVEGDSDVYRVHLSYPQEASGACDCKSAMAVCSHLFAASIYALAFPPDQPAPSTDDPFAGLN